MLGFAARDVQFQSQRRGLAGFEVGTIASFALKVNVTVFAE